MILNKLFKQSPQARLDESSALFKFLMNSGESNSGVVINSDTALRSSAVYACVVVLSETVAQLPLIYYQRKGRIKERALAESLYTILHDAPNAVQTSFEFRQMITAHAVLRGAGYAYKVMSASGEVLELWPMHPDRVQVKQLKDYSLSIMFTDNDGIEHPLRQDQVFRLMGMSLDGVNGVSPIEYQRESIGLSLAAEKYGALSFKNGAKMSGILKHPGKFKDKEVAERVRESFEAAASGNNQNKTVLLEDGLDWVKVSMSNQDAQYIEARKYQVEDIARIFRVPPHKIGHLEKSTNNNIEHQGLEFVTETMMPWFVRWEQAIMRDLIPKNKRQQFFAEFLVDGLLRGDSKARAEFYTKLFNIGSINQNEIRSRENLNPIDGGDAYYVPLNMEKISD